mmetsp:Transcript_80325/g.259570  ORF Transcript_80325/g.259570 Transcript_80325/m.259570 type:complete len:88 (+) Transcript_80325:2319-2582(+)
MAARRRGAVASAAAAPAAAAEEAAQAWSCLRQSAAWPGAKESRGPMADTESDPASRPVRHGERVSLPSLFIGHHGLVSQRESCTRDA